MPRPKKAEPRDAPAIHLVDTNVMLRFLMADDPPKASRAAALMERVERGEEIVELVEEVITETVWTLESYYKVPREETAKHIAAVLSFPGVRTASRKTLVHALQSYASTNADFVDCLLAARSRVRKIPVYTFDETDFKKLGVEWQRP